MSLSKYLGAGLLLKFSAKKLLWGENVAHGFSLVSSTEVTGLAVLQFPSLAAWLSSPTPDFYF